MGNIFFQRQSKTNPLPEFPEAGFNRFKYLKLPFKPVEMISLSYKPIFLVGFNCFKMFFGIAFL